MMFVDYQCRVCGGRMEYRVSSPPPASVDCAACGQLARRRYAPVRLAGRDRPPAAPPRATSAAPSCRDHPEVPALCHLTPETARGWIARARGDNRALDRELQRQEDSVRGGGTPEPVAHSHQRRQPPVGERPRE